MPGEMKNLVTGFLLSGDELDIQYYGHIPYSGLYLCPKNRIND